MTIPGIRLAAWSLFWRVAALVFLLAELRFWTGVRRWNIESPWQAIRPFVRKSPGYFTFAMGVAALATLGAAVLVRLVIGPQLRRWLHPRTEPMHAFYLSPRETVVADSPAQRAVGRSCWAGMLVRTDLRLWFFPAAWDAEPWSVPLGCVREVRTTPAPRVLWGLVTGLPDRLEVRGGADLHETFAVADPAPMLAWFQAARVTPVRVQA
jgi:hypothetical protein